MHQPTPPLLTGSTAPLRRLLRLGTERLQAALLLLTLALVGGLAVPGAPAEGDRGGGTAASAQRPTTSPMAVVAAAPAATPELAPLGSAPAWALGPTDPVIASATGDRSDITVSIAPALPAPPRGQRQPTGPPYPLS